MIYILFFYITLQGKKFAKPELKSCIEEFEGKISQFHIDKKEQELTARNAAVHQQKADAIKNITMDTNIEEESVESESAEGLHFVQTIMRLNHTLTF